MRRFHTTSGDLVADRRAAHAAGFAADGAHAAAAELMEQALELVPGWAAGWCLLGDYRAEAGNSAGAVAAWRQLQRLDRAGIFGGALKLAAHGAEAAPAGSDGAYVAALFDDYAGRFEGELVGALAYEGHVRLAAMLAAALAGRTLGPALDLGCGTGLLGVLLRPHVDVLEGIDLAGAMVTAAGRKGVYDRLEQADLRAYLVTHPGRLDLVTASDVLNYCGELAPVFSAVAARLAQSGLFAFTVEQHDGPEPMVLRPSLRYAHGAEATLAACRDAGFEVQASQSAPLRLDRGEPLVALYVVARKR